MKRFRKSLVALVIALSIILGTTTLAFAGVDINSSDVIKDYSNFIPSMTYNAKDRINNIKFFYNGERLNSIKDYMITYKNNFYPGIATITYTGVGNFEGTFVANFTIEKTPVTEITVKASFNKNKKLVVTANNGSSNLVEGVDFTYTASTDVDGNVKVNVKGIGDCYTGLVTKTISSEDNPNPSARSVLKVVKFTKVKNVKKKKVQLKWKKIKKIAGYQIKYSKKSNFASATKVFVKASAASKTITKLKKKKTYYFKMRSYINYNKKKYYSEWNTKKKVKIKK